MNPSIVLFVVLVMASGAFAATGKHDPVLEIESELLRRRLEMAVGPTELTAGGQRIHCEATLRRFYEGRLFAPAWTGKGGADARADSLVAALQRARGEGLQPGDYHLESVMTHLTTVREAMRRRRDPDPRRLVDLELLLTDAFVLCGSHYLAGRLDPETIDPEWFASRRQADLARVLEDALATGEIGTTLRSMLPPQPEYARLREALSRYRALAGGDAWPRIPAGPKLELGDRDERVVALRARLSATGELPPMADHPPTDSGLFDPAVDQAVRRFQSSHGLDVDGVVGPLTRAALDVTAAERARQIAVNLERWRWLPQDLGRRFLLVNIADFRLDVVENGRSVMDMAVIVGRNYRRTPVFSADMTYLVFSPAWEVPPKLAVQDILPEIQKDPGYLARQGFKVLQGWGAGEREIDPATLDWSDFSASDFPYRLRQMPGTRNALGKVKFMFPNKFNVYLHDTPNRELFARPLRAFSSGCIRIEKPEKLCAYLLADDPEWTRAAIRSAMDAGRERTVHLPRPVPVHLLYWTAWVASDGTICFRPDIYDRDPLVDAALQEPPPTPAGERPPWRSGRTVPGE